MTVQEKLRKLRIEKNLSQGEVAVQLGLKQGAYNKIEQGTSELKWIHIEKLAKFYNIHPVELITYGEKIEQLNFIYTKLKQQEELASNAIVNMNDWRKQAMFQLDYNNQLIEKNKMLADELDKSIERLSEFTKRYDKTTPQKNNNEKSKIKSKL